MDDQANTLFSLSIDQLPDAVALATLEKTSKYVEVNAAYCELLGCQKDQLIGQTLHSALTWENKLQANAIFEIILNGMPIDDLECAFTNFQGAKRISSISVRTITISDKKYLLLSHRDIQHRVMIEQQLKESEARWRFAVEGHDDALWEWRVSDQMVYRSPRWLRMLDLPHDKTLVSLQEHLSVLYEDDQQSIHEDFLKVLRLKNKELLSECRLKKSDGSLIWVSFRCRVMEQGYQQKVTKIIGTARDITTQKEHKKQLDEQLNRLSHSGRLLALGEMSSTIAHEINQPLGIVATYSGLLVRKIAQANNLSVLEELKGIAQKIEKQVLRAGNIVWRMREFARQGKLNIQAINLQTLIYDSLEWFQLDKSQNEINISVTLHSEEMVVYADRVLLEQVMLNLLKNAFQSMHESEHKPEIQIRSYQDDQAIVIEVADRGHGISLDGGDLYQRFFSTKDDGLGLGLSITHSIIERHQGKLWSERREGGGSLFSFSLPITSPDD